jgi:hypothetical protein
MRAIWSAAAERSGDGALDSVTSFAEAIYKARAFQTGFGATLSTGFEP